MDRIFEWLENLADKDASYVPVILGILFVLVFGILALPLLLRFRS